MEAFPALEAEADDVFNPIIVRLRENERNIQASNSELRSGVNMISAGLLVGLMMLGAWVFYGAPAYERMALINQEQIAWHR